jgi:hypothetical protein
MDAESNRNLREYFKARRAWLLEVGTEGASLEEIRPPMHTDEHR